MEPTEPTRCGEHECAADDRPDAQCVKERNHGNCRPYQDPTRENEIGQPFQDQRPPALSLAFCSEKRREDGEATIGGDIGSEQHDERSGCRRRQQQDNDQTEDDRRKAAQANRPPVARQTGAHRGSPRRSPSHGSARSELNGRSSRRFSISISCTWTASAPRSCRIRRAACSRSGVRTRTQRTRPSVPAGVDG